jgi:flagellin
MPFQVGANIAALNVYNNLGVHQAKSAASLARISSGLKSAGGGDVASAGTAATINGNMQKTQSYISQVQFAIGQLQTADTAYGELISLGQKGIEVGNRVTDAGADSSAITAQLTALKAGITSIQTNTQFNGTSVTASATANPTVGNGVFDATVTFATAPATLVAADFATFVDSTVDKRATNAGNIASLQNSLQVLNSVAANELQAMTQVQDTDIATEMMNLTSSNILTEAATAMLAQAMQLPNGVLKLLQ